MIKKNTELEIFFNFKMKKIVIILRKNHKNQKFNLGIILKTLR